MHTVFKLYPSEPADEWTFPLSVIGAGESVHLCHVQLQREEGWARGAPPTGWLHCGLHWPPVRYQQAYDTDVQYMMASNAEEQALQFEVQICC